MARGSGWAWMCGLVVAVVSGQARAEGQPAALSWVRGADAQDCASARELAAQVEAQMGRALFVAPAQATIWVEASIDRTQEPAGYVARFGLIEHADAVSATRTLVLPPLPCRELDPLLAFVLAAMLDPDAPLLPPRLPLALSEVARGMLADLFGNEPTVPPLELAAPSGETPAPTVTPTPSGPTEPIEQTPAAAAPREPEHPSDAPPTLTLFASAGAGAGLLPALDVSGSIEVRWRFAAEWIVRAGGSLWPEVSVSPTPASAVGFSALLGSLSVCPAPLWDGALPLRLCAGALLGSIATRARGVSLARNPSRPYAAASVSADVSWSPGAGFWLRAGAAGFVPLVRDRFVLEDTGDLHVAHEPSQVGGLFDAGLGLAFF